MKLSDLNKSHWEDFAQEEIEHYMLSSSQHMYLRKKGF